MSDLSLQDGWRKEQLSRFITDNITDAKWNQMFIISSFIIPHVPSHAMEINDLIHYEVA